MPHEMRLDLGFFTEQRGDMSIRCFAIEWPDEFRESSETWKKFIITERRFGIIPRKRPVKCKDLPQEHKEFLRAVMAIAHKIVGQENLYLYVPDDPYTLISYCEQRAVKLRREDGAVLILLSNDELLVRLLCSDLVEDCWKGMICATPYDFEEVAFPRRRPSRKDGALWGGDFLENSLFDWIFTVSRTRPGVFASSLQMEEVWCTNAIKEEFSKRPGFGIEKIPMR